MGLVLWIIPPRPVSKYVICPLKVFSRKFGTKCYLAMVSLTVKIPPVYLCSVPGNFDHFLWHFYEVPCTSCTDSSDWKCLYQFRWQTRAPKKGPKIRVQNALCETLSNQAYRFWKIFIKSEAGSKWCLFKKYVYSDKIIFHLCSFLLSIIQYKMIRKNNQV